MPTFTRRLGSASPKLDLAELRRLANRMLRAIDREQAELSVLLVDDERIREVNREHRNKDRPTDVLAFPLPKVRRPPAGSPILLGDIVISLQTALRQARSRRRPLLLEVRFLLAHGLLHLVGFDHATKAEKRTMDRETRRLVKAAADRDQGKPKPKAKSRRKATSTPTSRTNSRVVRGRGRFRTGKPPSISRLT